MFEDKEYRSTSLSYHDLLTVRKICSGGRDTRIPLLSGGDRSCAQGGSHNLWTFPRLP